MRPPNQTAACTPSFATRWHHLPQPAEAFLGTTSTPLTRYAMLESTMDNLLLAAIAASADVPVTLSNGWRYGAPIPAGPLTEMDVWNIVPANPQVSVATLTWSEV